LVHAAAAIYSMDAISGGCEDDRVAAVLESLDLPALILDPEGTVSHINELAGLILDVGRAELIGQAFFACHTDNPHHLQVRAAVERALSYPCGEQQTEVSLRVRGRAHVYLLKAAPLHLEGADTFGTIVTLHDVSYLRYKERARANLIATLSNGLREPLTSLSLGIELLQREAAATERCQIMKSVVEDLERLRELSEGLLDLSHDETVSIVVGNVSFDFSRLLASIAKKFSLLAGEKGIGLHAQIATGIESYGDPVKLAWVISNLLESAVRYTPDGGSVEVSTDLVGKDLRLSISDTGPGIPRDIIEAAFDPHDWRLPNGLENGSRSLGLAIVREIIEAHGGRLIVETSTGGNAVLVNLPHSRSI
jgi:signal transduction histidine kinase